MKENRLPQQIITPEQAMNRLKQLGYSSWTKVALGQSDFLDALVTAATSREPVDLNEVRDIHRRRMRGRV